MNRVALRNVSRASIPMVLLLSSAPLAAQEPAAQEPAAQEPAAEAGEEPTAEERRRRREMRDPKAFTMLRDEGFPLNVDPETVAAGEAELDDGDLVLGIVHNGETRAYPVNYMNGPTNEVVNDDLGGTAIASTW